MHSRKDGHVCAYMCLQLINYAFLLVQKVRPVCGASKFVFNTAIRLKDYTRFVCPSQTESLVRRPFENKWLVFSSDDGAKVWQKIDWNNDEISRVHHTNKPTDTPVWLAYHPEPPMLVSFSTGECFWGFHRIFCEKGVFK